MLTSRAPIFNSAIAKFVIVALAYFITAKLGLMVPYKESIVTLIWLPTGIAVGAIMRWGIISLPAIYLAAVLVEYTTGVSILASLAIAITNTAAPWLTAYMLNKLHFNHNLIKERDIGLMVGAALLGMLVSATGGVIALYFSNHIAPDELARVWLMWWMGDSVGVLLALPLVLNIFRARFHINTEQLYQLLVWLILFVVCEILVSVLMTSLNKQFMLSILLIFPVLIWASMSFGIVGGSLVVILLSAIAVWATSQGVGAFYSMDAREGIFSLWMFLVSLVVVMLLISVLQSKRNLAEKALLDNEIELRAVINGALDGIVTIDANDTVIEFNPSAERIFGYTRAEAMGRTLAELIVPPALRQMHVTKQREFARTGKKHMFDRRVELTAMRADGSEFPAELTLISMPSGNSALVTGFIRDISVQKKALQEIENYAYYDTLTGLPNRRLLTDRFQHAMVVSKRSKAYGALIFLDLDNFKALNDTKGHDVGDQLLIEVAGRIQHSIRAGDTVARLSGDEFVIVLEDLDADENVAYRQANEIAQKILLILNEPYHFEMFEFSTSASLGVTLFNSDEFGFEDHLRHADTAMYQSKSSGRNTYRFYDQATQSNMERNFVIDAALDDALRNNAFYLHYQSIVDVDRKVNTAEVLLRWTHPVLGNVGPAEFIPIAEKSNKIIKIGHWVLLQACRQLKAWETSPKLRKIRLSVNISAKQFLYVNFVQELRDIIAETGIDPDLLKLELTETAVIDNIDEVMKKMHVLKDIGIRVSLDDFGMGHSALAYLKKLPVTQIKIDRSFVHDMLTDSNDAAIIQMILAIGKTIRCKVVAEGVELQEQFDALNKLGCHYYQGYYFSRPTSVEDFEKNGQRQLTCHATHIF